MNDGKMYSKKRKNTGCGGCFFFSIFFLISLIVLLILLLVGMYFFLRKDYLIWENDFEGKKESREYIYYDEITEYDTIGDKEIIKADSLVDTTQSIDRKIEILLINNGEEIKSTTFTSAQSHLLLGDILRKGISKEFKLFRTYLESEDEYWILYYQLKFRGVRMPWIVIDLEKGEYERSYPDVKKISIGNYDLDEIGLYFIREKVNENVRDVAQQFSYNSWGDVIIENIEFGEDELFIKVRATE